jgi:hypothetical protein
LKLDNKLTDIISLVSRLNEFSFLDAIPIASEANDLLDKLSIYFFAPSESSAVSSGL